MNLKAMCISQAFTALFSMHLFVFGTQVVNGFFRLISTTQTNITIKEDIQMNKIKERQFRNPALSVWIRSMCKNWGEGSKKGDKI